MAQIFLTPMRDICQPGVTNKSPGKGAGIEYGFFPAYQAKSNDDKESEVQMNIHLLVKLKAPIIRKEKTKVLVGVRYFQETYDFEKVQNNDFWLFDNLEGKVLKNSKMSIYMSHSFNFKHYFGLKAEASFTGDYDGLISFDERYRNFNLIGVFGIKRSKHIEWGLGLAGSFGYRGNTAYPFVIYNRTFNDKWGVESTLPIKFMIRHNINLKSLILFGGEYSSRFYSIDMEKNNTGPVGRYQSRNSNFQLNIALNRQIASWVWIETKGGYVFYQDGELNGEVNIIAPSSDFTTKHSSGVFFKCGVFVSPPRSYYTKNK